MNIRTWSWIAIIFCWGCVGQVSSINKRDSKKVADMRWIIDLKDNTTISPRDVKPHPDLPLTRDYGKPSTQDKSIVRRDLGGTTIKLTALEKELFDTINAARQKRGLSSVSIEEHLLCAERKHVQDVVPTSSCGHIGTDGSTYVDRAKGCGYPTNLAWQVVEIGAGAPSIPSTPSWAVNAWANDPPHAQYLFHSQAKWVGIGAYSNCYYALFDCCISP